MVKGEAFGHKILAELIDQGPARSLLREGNRISSIKIVSWREEEGVSARAFRSKLEVADIFRRHGEAWRAANAGHVNLAQRRVMTAIEICRTDALGGHVERCQDCEHSIIAYNSCRNRHCPKCQGRAAAAWLRAREAELLPVPYFHFVFVLPRAITPIAYQNQAKVYGLLFKAASEALITIAADQKHLGADIGVIAALHTWGQNLQYHPHVHCVVPGGGVSPDGKRWIRCRTGFFLPVRVLSRLFRRLFLDGLAAAFKAGVLQFFAELAHLKLANGVCGNARDAAEGRMARLCQEDFRRS